MSNVVAAVSITPKIGEVKEPFDTKRAIVSSHTQELVIALCGPIGSPLHKVARTIKERLEDDFGYKQCEIIHLSKLIEKHGKGNVPESPAYKRIKALIDSGDKLRADFGPSILAELAVYQIMMERKRDQELRARDSIKPAANRFPPRRVCHIIDSVKNQEELDVLRLVYRDMVYFVGVYAPLPARIKALEAQRMTQAEIFSLIDRDSGEELTYGQTVRDTFPQADFFLRMDADTDTQIKSKVERFLHLILGTKVLTPTDSEAAMYAAASAAGNSACLSRQVGAAICDKDGKIIAVGWNDVPRFGGGLYASDPKHDANSDRDKRCWNMDGGVCFNDEEKRVLSEILVRELIAKKVLPEAKRDQAIDVVIRTKVKDLIEFSRAIHAEMLAILSAGQIAGEKIKGGKLFCTTYPCHSCARHIIAAGITEVYFIEPYRKSLATRLHGDAITEDESDTRKVRLLPFDGVAPSRYLKLFRVPSDCRKKDGKMIKVDLKIATPRFDKTMAALTELEALVVKGLHKKRAIDVTGVADEESEGANDA